MQACSAVIFCINAVASETFLSPSTCLERKQTTDCYARQCKARTACESIALVWHSDRRVSITECNTTQTATALRTTQSRHSAQETHITHSNISINYNVPVCTLTVRRISHIGRTYFSPVSVTRRGSWNEYQTVFTIQPDNLLLKDKKCKWQ